MLYDKENDIEKIFTTDVIEKKRTARGIYAMTGKRGYIGKMRMPSDFMNRKDRKQYTQGGKVMTTNFYNDINNVPTLEELAEKYKVDPSGTTKMLENVRRIHSGAKLAKHWGYSSNSSVFTIWAKYGVKAPASRIKSGRKKKEVKDVEFSMPSMKSKKDDIPTSTLELIEAQKNIFLQQIQNQQLVAMPNSEPQVKIEEEKEDLFNIKYNKKAVTGEAIANRLSYIVGVLESDVKYKIRVEIVEVEEETIAVEEPKEILKNSSNWTIADELKNKGFK